MQNFPKYIEKIMPLCLALFFVRTIFIGYKYLFFATLVPCFLYSIYVLFKHGVVRLFFKSLLLPMLVVILFLAHISLLSNVVKECVNIAFLVYFIAFSKLYYSDEKCDEFLKCIVRLTQLAGFVAIARFSLSMVGLSVPLSGVLFEGKGFALVNDANFYSLFFITSIVLSTKLFAYGQIKKWEYRIVNVISVINVVAGVSRRAYMLYVLLFAIVIMFADLKKYDLKKTMLYNTLAISVIALFVTIEFVGSNAHYTPNMPVDQKNRYYKMYTLIDSDMSYNEFNIKQCGKYYEKLDDVDPTNMFFCGDLQKYGLDAWDTLLSSNDCLMFGLFCDVCGDSVIRVSRECSDGYWQVHYKGRPIVYYKDVTYTIVFAYRVLEGPSHPFCVGWWVNEGQGYKANLPRTIEPIDSVWNRCIVSYKFKEERMNPTCFLNSLRAGSTIEVKDIRLTCDDTTGLPRYVDQLPDSVIHKYYSKDTINYFTAPRTDRWRYALELWQTRYNTKQKIFGQGFKYLEWYGEKFWNNPKRYDFPHNPIISSFLYSGIIGGVVYIIFLIMSLWLYWKKRRQLGIFFIMYLCCMFFSMFSGSSHFSFPLFAFLSLLPFVEYKSDVDAEKVNVIKG